MLREKGGTLALQTIRGDKMILGPTKEAHDSISGHSQCNNWESSGVAIHLKETGGKDVFFFPAPVAMYLQSRADGRGR